MRLEFGILKPQISGALLRALAEQGGKRQIVNWQVNVQLNNSPRSLVRLHRELVIFKDHSDLICLTFNDGRIGLYHVNLFLQGKVLIYQVLNLRR